MEKLKFLDEIEKIAAATELKSGSISSPVWQFKRIQGSTLIYIKKTRTIKISIYHFIEMLKCGYMQLNSGFFIPLPTKQN